MSEYSGISIEVGATFPDYASFENAFKRYCESTGYVFAKDGKTVEAANRKIQNPALHFKPEFKYQIVSFHCKHFGEYTSKGKGIRKTQMSYKIGCKASLRLSADRQKDCLEIRHFEPEHSHPVAGGIGHVYPEVRRPNAEQSEQVKNLLDVQVPVTSIQRVIGEKHGLKMLSHDIHNLREKNRKAVQNARTDAEMLHDSLQALISNDPGCTVSVLEDSGVISVIFLQTTAMKRMLNAYGSMVFIDGTYCVNRYGMPLYVFVVVDGNRQGQIVGYGIIRDERAATLRSLFYEFEKHSKISGKIQVAMVDKDLNEISKLREVYPQVRIMLCRFHVLKAFRTGTADNCDREHREQVRGLIETMVYSTSEEQYKDALSEISNVSPQFMEYYQRSWSNCIDSWAGFRLKDVPHSGHYTNNIVESHNQKIKAIIKRNATLPELINGLLHLQLSKGIADQQKVSSMVLKTPSVAPGVSAVTRAAMHQISGVATNVIAVKLMSQLEKSENCTYSVGCGEGDTILIKSGERHYVISSDLMRCTCLFFLQFSLPCSHIFFARRQQGHPVFIDAMVPQDAKKSVLLAAMRSGENVTQTHGAFLTRTNTQSHAVPESSKFRVAMEELKILASSMVKCNNSRFEARVQQVRQLHSLWWSDKDVSITGISASHVPSSSASPTVESVSMSIPSTHVSLPSSPSVAGPSSPIEVMSSSRPPRPDCSASTAPAEQVVSVPSTVEPVHPCSAFNSTVPVVSVSLTSEGDIPPTSVQGVSMPSSSTIAGPSSPIEVMSSSRPAHPDCSASKAPVEQVVSVPSLVESVHPCSAVPAVSVLLTSEGDIPPTSIADSSSPIQIISSFKAVHSCSVSVSSTTSSVAGTSQSSNSDVLSPLKFLNIPPPMRVRGRPKGIHLTVVGKKKRKRGDDKAAQKSKKTKISPDAETFLHMLADREVVNQTLRGKTKLTEEQIECRPEHVPNEIVNCVKDHLKPYFTSDGWVCFLSILQFKEKKLYTCPVCSHLDDHTLKMICCDKPGCEHWFHFQCIGMTSESNPEVTEWICHECQLLC